MTAPMRGTPKLSAVPASQNTAPVAEFRCLFTHDVRRKQKRWQDGYLKFHSFNSRVIVYDASRFVVGETYYKDNNELQEGDELTLDRGVMVEVAEAVGVTQTDLTPLFERKTKDSPQRNNPAVAQKPFPKPTIPASNPLRVPSQLRHKSLNTLLGTPKGPIGKALPVRSPFEERKEKESRHAEERAAKRQKTTHEAQVQQVDRPAAAKDFTLKRAPSLSNKPVQGNGSGARSKTKPIPRGAAVINLSSETDTLSSLFTLLSTPSRPATTLLPHGNSAPARKESLPTQNPIKKTPKLPKGKVPIPLVKDQQIPEPRPQPFSPPVSASNRISNVDFAVQPMPDPPKESSPVSSPKKPLQPVQRKTKSLRLSTGVKRGTLLCQPAQNKGQPVNGALHIHIIKESSNRGPLQKNGLDSVLLNNDKAAIETEKPPQGSWEILDDMELVHGLMDQQLQVNRPPPNVHETAKVNPKPPRSKSATTRTASSDTMELTHGLMDQQLLITSSPPDLSEVANSNTPTPKPISTKKAPKGRKAVKDIPEEEAESQKKRAKATKTKKLSIKQSKKRKEKVEEPIVIPSQSSSEVSEHNFTAAPSRELSAAPSIAATGKSRNASNSVSPRKLAALSTGGFRKKPKPRPVQDHRTAPENFPPALQSTTVALPPHHLRANKNRPLMSTTELSTSLEIGPKSIRPEDDPFEDDTRASTNRSPYRRIRSLNDAPIPSTSEDWELRNLPKDPQPTITAAHQKPKTGGLASLVKKTDPRRKFKRTQSLSVATDCQNADDQEVVSPPPRDDDVGPWSTEAFDMFDWKPPGKEWKPEGAKMRLVDVDVDVGGDGQHHQAFGMLADGR